MIILTYSHIRSSPAPPYVPNGDSIESFSRSERVSPQMDPSVPNVSSLPTAQAALPSAWRTAGAPTSAMARRETGLLPCAEKSAVPSRPRPPCRISTRIEVWATSAKRPSANYQHIFGGDPDGPCLPPPPPVHLLPHSYISAARETSATPSAACSAPNQLVLSPERRSPETHAPRPEPVVGSMTVGPCRVIRRKHGVRQRKRERERDRGKVN